MTLTVTVKQCKDTDCWRLTLQILYPTLWFFLLKICCYVFSRLHKMCTLLFLALFPDVLRFASALFSFVHHNCVFLLYILIIAVFPLRDGGWNSVANGVFFPVCSILPRTIAVYCENQKTLSNFVYAMLFRPLIVFRKMLLFAFCSHWEWYRQPNTVLLLFYAVCIPYISAPVMFPNCFAACPCFAVVAATPRSPPNAIATMFHQFLTNSNVGLQMWDYNTCCAKHNHHWQAIKNAAQKKTTTTTNVSVLR